MSDREVKMEMQYGVVMKYEWAQAVETAIETFKSLVFTIHFFTRNELFNCDQQDNGMSLFSIKPSMFALFEIFPWLQFPKMRNRQEIFEEEQIQEVTDAVNEIRKSPLVESDLLRLKEFYLLNGPPLRLLWGITEVRSFLRKKEERGQLLPILRCQGGNNLSFEDIALCDSAVGSQPSPPKQQQGKRRRNDEDDEDEIEVMPESVSPHSFPEVEASFQKLSVSSGPREREILAEMESLKKQLELYLSCLFHQKILKEARERNAELMRTYQSCCDDLDDDERFEPTRKLYSKLIGELAQASKKMSGIEEDLMKKSSVTPEVYRVRKGELDASLASLRMEMQNGDPCE
jgi:hypothetical protein